MWKILKFILIIFMNLKFTKSFLSQYKLPVKRIIVSMQSNKAPKEITVVKGDAAKLKYDELKINNWSTWGCGVSKFP